MRKEVLLLLVLFCFVDTSLNAQQLQLNWSKARGYEDLNSNLSLSYIFSPKTFRSTALNLNYLTTGKRDNRYDNRTDIFQLDVMERWIKKSPSGRIHSFAAVGVSAMLLNQDRNWYFDDYYYTDLIYDPISSYYPYDRGSNGEVGLAYNRKDRYYLLSFLPGLVTTMGLNVNITKHFYLGMFARFSGYYDLEDKEPILYIDTGLSAGWRF